MVGVSRKSKVLAMSIFFILPKWFYSFSKLIGTNLQVKLVK